METTYTANISAFMRGAAKKPEGWHKDINWGDYAFAIALREQYFPLRNVSDLFKVKLVFEIGNEEKNQNPALVYLKDMEFPADVQLTELKPRRHILPVNLFTHLQQCLGKLDLSLVVCEKGGLPKDSDALELRKIVSAEDIGDGKLKLGNGELAKITNRVLEGQVDHVAEQIRERYRGNNKPSTKHLRPRDSYRGFLHQLLESAGIENASAVANEAVDKIGTGCGNWDKALTRATQHAKEIIPQTRMYKTTIFEIDGQRLEVREKMQGRDWVGMATGLGTMLGMTFQGEGR